MASTRNTNLLTQELFIKAYDFDPGTTSAVDVAWVSAADVESFLVQFVRTIGTADLTFVILGNTTATGSGTDVTIKTKTLTGIQPNAVGDNSFLEVSADEIKKAADDAGVVILGLSASLAVATDSDEAVVNYIVKRRSYSGNTADVIA